MSTVQEIEAALARLSPKEMTELKRWLDDFFEDHLELMDEVKAKLEPSGAETASGQFSTPQP